MSLANEVAQVLYTAEFPAVEWEHALPEDRQFYERVSDVIVDTVVTYLQGLNSEIPARAVADYIAAETEIARLKRVP